MLAVCVFMCVWILWRKLFFSQQTLSGSMLSLCQWIFCEIHFWWSWNHLKCAPFCPKILNFKKLKTHFLKRGHESTQNQCQLLHKGVSCEQGCVHFEANSTHIFENAVVQWNVLHHGHFLPLLIVGSQESFQCQKSFSKVHCDPWMTHSCHFVTVVTLWGHAMTKMIFQVNPMLGTCQQHPNKAAWAHKCLCDSVQCLFMSTHVNSQSAQMVYQKIILSVTTQQLLGFWTKIKWVKFEDFPELFSDGQHFAKITFCKKVNVFVENTLMWACHTLMWGCQSRDQFGILKPESSSPHLSWRKLDENASLVEFTSISFACDWNWKWNCQLFKQLSCWTPQPFLSSFAWDMVCSHLSGWCLAMGIDVLHKESIKCATDESEKVNPNGLSIRMSEMAENDQWWHCEGRQKPTKPNLIHLWNTVRPTGGETIPMKICTELEHSLKQFSPSSCTNNAETTIRWNFFLSQCWWEAPHGPKQEQDHQQGLQW